MSDAKDRVLECADCGTKFVFTAGEQAFYQERGFSEPRRCPSCRSARRAQRSGEGRYSESSSGWDSDYSGRDRRGRKERAPRQMYDVICAGCGQPTQVPFQPRDDRPVYCKDCYEARK